MGMAQGVENRTHDLKVEGSSPADANTLCPKARHLTPILSMRKSNPECVSVNVHSAAGRTFACA